MVVGENLVVEHSRVFGELPASWSMLEAVVGGGGAVRPGASGGGVLGDVWWSATEFGDD